MALVGEVVCLKNCVTYGSRAGLVGLACIRGRSGEFGGRPLVQGDVLVASLRREQPVLQKEKAPYLAHEGQRDQLP